ncbi:MAG: hypothetical protein KDC38_12470, partial [Planctomycetes bacterium]|nr:hypothetical protein [Planctomycetota bacterium]
STRAVDDRLEFCAPPDTTMELTGFTSAEVSIYRVESPLGEPAPGRVTGAVISPAPDGTWSARFQTPPGSGGRYLAGTPTLAVAPGAIDVGAEPLTPPTTPVDVIAIAPRAWHATLGPWVALRESQGWAVQLVDVESVFVTYDGGRRSTRAIERFLSDAMMNWPTPRPRAVLLVGDATFDPAEHLGPSNRVVVPTRLIETTAFQSGSDVAMTDGDADGLPDLAIGRLPVATIDECAAVVDKLVASPASSDVLTLVADAEDLVPGSRFATRNQGLAVALSSRYTPITIEAIPSDPAITRQAIATAWPQSAVVMYTGHGSRTAWSALELLTAADVASLPPTGSLPWVISFNCISAYFIHPQTPSLAEALVVTPDRGALAYFGPTSVTSLIPQGALAETLTARLATGADATIGEAILAVQRELGSDPSLREVIESWVLLGDPTTPIP